MQYDGGDFKEIFGFKPTAANRKLNIGLAAAIFICVIVIILFMFLIMLNAYGHVGTSNDAAFDKGMSTTAIILAVAVIAMYGVQFGYVQKRMISN